jgi:sugar O-acyltransferase (sialic acid O-acetyltransferase NeuD family)
MTGGRLVIVGGGEHARVVAEAALAAGWTVIGYTDAAASSPGPLAAGGAGDDRVTIPFLGHDGPTATRLGADADPPALVLGFGGPSDARHAAVDAFGAAAHWAVVVHPAAIVSPSADLAEGAVVLAGAVIGPGASIGRHAIVNSRAVAEHDVTLGDHAHLAPGATVGGGTRIGADAFVGLGAAVRDHIRIGDGATVGMGAVVVADVPAGATVVGTPARVRGAGIARTDG